MDHHAYMRSLRASPNASEYEIATRVYKNASGVDALIYLHQGYWDYVDWLTQNADGFDFGEWVIHYDKTPCEGYTLSHVLMYLLWEDECERFRFGTEKYKPYPPMGYEGWADENIVRCDIL